MTNIKPSPICNMPSQTCNTSSHICNIRHKIATCRRKFATSVTANPYTPPGPGWAGPAGLGRSGLGRSAGPGRAGPGRPALPAGNPAGPSPAIGGDGMLQHVPRRRRRRCCTALARRCRRCCTAVLARRPATEPRPCSLGRSGNDGTAWRAWAFVLAVRVPVAAAAAAA